MESILQIKNLWKSFDGLKAVSELSFLVKQGKITSLIGPNGAGKSTVFNLITGFLKLDKGNIYFRGQDVTGIPAYQIANMGIVRTFQDLKIFNQVTVRENVLLGMQETHKERIRHSIFFGKTKHNKTQLNKKADELLEFVKLKNLAGEIAENISYAEKKLLVLARALATDAELILLDEPVSGLAQDSVEHMLDIFWHLIQQGKTVLLVEHNMDVVIKVSDYVIVIDFGKKIAEGTPDQIKSDKKVIQVYLGIS